MCCFLLAHPCMLCCMPPPPLSPPSPLQVLQVLQALTSDPANEVWVISGRSQQELGAWFQTVVSVDNKGTEGAQHAGGVSTACLMQPTWRCNSPFEFYLHAPRSSCCT